MSEISEKEVEIASKAYADATGYYVEFHRGLSSPSADQIRKGVRAALEAAAHARAEAVGMRVKPLEWEETHTKRSDEDPTTEVTGFEAETTFGTFYTIEVGAAWFHVVYDYKGLGQFETEFAAKAAAQADYERRILSALSHPAVPEGMYGEYTPVTVGTGTADATLSARVAQLEEALREAKTYIECERPASSFIRAAQAKIISTIETTLSKKDARG